MLAKQYEEFKEEIDVQRKQWSSVQELVASQETQITQMNNMIEQVGHDKKVAKDEKNTEEPIEGVDQMELLDFVADLNDNPDAYHTDTTEIIKEADHMLASPFSFYGFGI